MQHVKLIEFPADCGVSRTRRSDSYVIGYVKLFFD